MLLPEKRNVFNFLSLHIVLFFFFCIQIDNRDTLHPHDEHNCIMIYLGFEPGSSVWQRPPLLTLPPGGPLLLEVPKHTYIRDTLSGS